MSELKYDYVVVNVREATKEDKDNAVDYCPVSSPEPWTSGQKYMNDRYNHKVCCYGNSPATYGFFLVRRDKKENFLIWSPTAETPPTKILTSEKQAQVVAEKMAKANPDSEFYIAKLVSKVKVTVTTTSEKV